MAINPINPTRHSNLINEQEAAIFLHIAPATLSDWRWRGVGPHYLELEDKSIRYQPDDLDRFVRDDELYRFFQLAIKYDAVRYKEMKLGGGNGYWECRYYGLGLESWLAKCTTTITLDDETFPVYANQVIWLFSMGSHVAFIPRGHPKAFADADGIPHY